MKPYSEIENIEKYVMAAKKMLLEFDEEETCYACFEIHCDDCPFNGFVFEGEDFCNAAADSEFEKNKKLKDFLQGLVDFAEKNKRKIRFFGKFELDAYIEVFADNATDAQCDVYSLIRSKLKEIGMDVGSMNWSEVESVTIDPAKEKAEEIISGLSGSELEALKELLKEKEKHLGWAKFEPLCSGCLYAADVGGVCTLCAKEQT